MQVTSCHQETLFRYRHFPFNCKIKKFLQHSRSPQGSISLVRLPVLICVCAHMRKCLVMNLGEHNKGDYTFYATLTYIRHFISAGCYDNDPWYLVTNLRGIQILRGFTFLNAPLILNAPLNLLLGTSNRPAFSSCDGGSPTINILYLPGLEHAPPLIES